MKLLTYHQGGNRNQPGGSSVSGRMCKRIGATRLSYMGHIDSPAFLKKHIDALSRDDVRPASGQEQTSGPYTDPSL